MLETERREAGHVLVAYLLAPGRLTTRGQEGRWQERPCVVRVEHEDRELLLGWGKPDLQALEEALRDWWSKTVLEPED